LFDDDDKAGRLRILFMAATPASPDSGAAGTEYQTIEALRRLGHEVEAVWGDDLPHRIAHGNLYYLLELPRAYKREMLDRLRQKPFDVIHVNQPHGYHAARTLKRLRRECVFIHRSHGLETRAERDLARWRKMYGRDTRSPLRKLASRSMALALSRNSRGIARFADGHIVSASQCRDFMREVMGVPEERIAVIPQAPPPLFLEIPPGALTAERLGRILYVGQYAFFKAPAIVAQVFNRLAEANERLQFTWVCAREHHIQVREALSPEAGRRTAILDWMPQDELRRVYDGHGIFLFPSFFEGFGKVFLEAMSRGLCVVAADNGGAHDLIVHGSSGVLSPTGCADAMVTQCLELANSFRLARAMSEEAVKCARSHTWERAALETASFYRERLDAKLLGPRAGHA
jgi:glycosyltransferase involved in cell wall biosynthesis